MMENHTHRLWICSLVLLLAVGSAGCEIHARALSVNIQAKHLPFGTILDPIFASPASNDIAGYTRCGDSALWTGHYLAAESYRYKVTRSPEALVNAQHALAGLQSLVDVTGTDLLARCLVPMSSPYAAGINREESNNGVYNSGQNFWIGHTSRDQYSGVFFGLSVAYDLLDDPASKASIQSLVTRMLDFLLAKGWSVVMPDGSISTTFALRPDEQLSLLQVGRQVNPAQFGSQYASLSAIGRFTMVAPVLIDAQDDRSSYFKFNLDAINLFDLIRLEDSSSRRDLYRTAYGLFHDVVKSHGNAHFNMIDRALNGANAARDAETVTLLNLWLQRPRRDVFVDLRGAYTSCVSPDQSCLPIPVNQRVTTDFLWQRSPFQLTGGGAGVIESAGIDYILPYWMARYYGVVLN